MEESTNKNFYDQNAPYRDMLEGKRSNAIWFRHYYEAILQHSKPESLILDVGCGTGVTTCYLHQFRPKIQGVDFSSLFIQEARRYAPFFRTMDMTALEFPDESFDLVCSADAIEHCSQLEVGLSEMIRILKPRGHLVLQAPNLSCSVLSTNYAKTPRNICTRFYRLLTDLLNPRLKTVEHFRLETLTGDKDAFNLISPIWLRRHLRQRGFRICSLTTYACYFQPSPTAEFAFNLASKLPLLKEIGGRLVLVARKESK